MKSLIKKAVFAFCYYSGLWLLFRFLNRNKIAVLMYHGVTDKDINCWTQLPKDKFEIQMRYISRNYSPRHLTDAAKILRRDIAPSKYAIVITFDDGFNNNMTTAYPILKRYSIPAIIFLATSFVDKNPRFAGLLWTDYILALFRNTGLKQVDLSDINLGKYDLINLQDRHQAKETVCRALKKLNYDEKNRIIEIISSRLGNKISSDDYEIFRSLDWQDVSVLSKERLIEFGAHTVNHEILSRMPKNAAEKEISDSQITIGKATGKPVSFFAYPNGTRADFNNETKAIAAEHFKCALTTIEGLNSIGSDMYELKRINIGNDISMMEFKLLISGTVDFIRRFMSGTNKSYCKSGH